MTKIKQKQQKNSSNNNNKRHSAFLFLENQKPFRLFYESMEAIKERNKKQKGKKRRKKRANIRSITMVLLLSSALIE